MAISGIGTSCTYIYNSQTGKLSSKDGTKDPFVDYFNGDRSDETRSQLNGFDACRKEDIISMVEVLNKVFNDANGYEYEISDEIVDAVTATYSVNGKKVFTSYKAVVYTYEELRGLNSTGPYKTRQSKGYNPEDNSINIAVGDVINLGNGYRLTVMEDSIYGEGYGQGNVEDDKKMHQLVYGLNALIRFADQQWFSCLIDKESTPMLLELLRELGVDTSREFTINETKCEVVNGRINEVGNRFVVPNSVFNKAAKRYEELMYQPLSNRK